MSEAELKRLNIYHETDDNHSFRQLHSLYGKVNADQDKDIINAVFGSRVLDIGSGYGTLSRRLIDTGFKVTSIEPHEKMRELAKQWHNVEELPYSIYQTPFPEKSFDTVILRECVEHLDFPLALTEIQRICRGRVIIFQTNLNTIITLIRGLLGHQEYNPRKLEYYVDILKSQGFSRHKVAYRDILAFPLSGGYISFQFIPHRDPIESSVIRLDKSLMNVAGKYGIAKWISWRYLLTADCEYKR